MLRALLFAMLSSPATISVDVDALALPQGQAEQLHGELMTRLLEEGHAVGTTGAVVVRLVGGIAGDDGLVHVEVVHGADVRTRDVHGRGAVLRLATIHATLELLAGVDVIRDADAALVADPARAVAIEVAPGAEVHTAAVVAAVVATGRVVTPSVADAAQKLCVEDRSGAIAIAVVEGDAACEGLVEVAAVDPAIADALQTPAAPPAVVEVPAARVDAPAPTARAAPSPPPPIPSPPSWTWHVGVGVGVQGRLRPVEPAVLAHLDARHRSGATLTMRTTVAPWRDRNIATADTFVTLGAGWGRALGRRLRFDAALAGGLAVHAFRVGADRGARVDGTIELPVRLGVALGSRVELGLAAVAGFTGRGRRHLAGDTTLWSRDRVRLAAMLGLDVALGGKLRGRRSAEGS